MTGDRSAQDVPLHRLLEQGVASHEAGDLPTAERLYRAILDRQPDCFDALHDLGVLCARQGRFSEALDLLRRALAQEPDSADALNHSGWILDALHRPSEALACLDQALAIDGDYAEAHYNRGNVLQALGQPDAAVAAFEAAIVQAPDLAAARRNLGIALQTLGRHDAAVPHYQRALAIESDDADAHNNLGFALGALGRPADAITHHERAIALRPGFAAAHNNLGLVLQALDRHDEAIAHYRTALSLGPRSAARHANLGMALQEVGRLDEAGDAFARAIQLAPKTGRFYRNLADCRRFTAGAPVFVAMQQLVDEGDRLFEEDRRQVLFALAKALADIGEHERAFGHMLQGNELQRRRMEYNEERVLGEFTRIQSVFTPGLIAGRQGLGDPSPAPVFIVGMPRSGTTLVEQVLASHPGVFGAGELPNFEREVAALRAADGTAAPFPDAVPALAGEQLRQLGARYLTGLPAAARAAARVTDKMPLNFVFAGLIHLALPNARIIHTRRDPIDTCFSCFATLFTGSHRIPYDLSEIGRYYRAYDRLMEHWRAVLPSGVMLEIQYEELVGDFERHARRVIGHCGLEWDTACLDFHRTTRPVRTASVAQVRQPIQGSAIGRWRPYRHKLGSLLTALGVDQSGQAVPP